VQSSKREAVLQVNQAMQNRWYGDKRDLVKWGVVLHLAREYKVDRILQVAYLRETTWPQIEIDGEPLEIPKEVIQHFRRVKNIEGLTARPRIEVLDCTFSDRKTYMAAALAAVAATSGKTRLFFLDPDTGLEPRKKPSLDHVLNDEAKDIWGAMRQGDVLVLYQHETNKAGQPWVEDKRGQFESALALPSGCAKLAWGPKVAPDVAFFYCVKNELRDSGGTGEGEDPVCRPPSHIPEARRGSEGAPRCRWCQVEATSSRRLEPGTPRECPEGDHVFRGKGWDGFDAHWKAKHEGVGGAPSYKEVWAGLCSGERHHR